MEFYRALSVKGFLSYFNIMKNRTLSILLFVASLCAITTSAFAEPEEGFYEKHDIRGFISFGADYRGMRSAYADYLNKVLFNKNQGYMVQEVNADGDTITTIKPDGSIGSYEHFNDYYLGMHVEVGAQYHQFLTWFDINFMPTQISDKPSAKSSASKDLYDVKWFAYGIDWMFGWKLFGENTVINLIPSFGIGFNLLNIHLASNYDFESSDGTYVNARNRYYSVFSPTFNSELELRLAFDPFSIGVYGGYRVIRFNEFDVEGAKLGDPDNNGDTYFIGAKVTWTFLSENQKKLRDKL